MVRLTSTGLLDLSSPGHPAASPAWLRAALADLLAPPAAVQVTAAVAGRHGRDPDQALLTGGSAPALALLAEVLAPQRTVLVHPGAHAAERALRAIGRPVAQAVLAPPFDALEVPDEADLVVLDSPGGVTGMRLDVARLCRPGRTTVVDETLLDLVPEEAGSLASRTDLPGLVVLRSPARAGADALRAGYLLAPEELVARLRAAGPAVPDASALAALRAWASPPARAELRRAALVLAAERARLERLLLGLGVEVSPGSQAPLLLCRVPDRPEVRGRLRGLGIVVRDHSAVPGLGPDWFGVAVRDRASADRLVQALWALLAAF